jgi:hypothetical protein
MFFKENSFFLIFQLLLTFKPCLVDAITDDEADNLLIEAWEDKHSALNQGIKQFNQHPDVAGQVYINYLKMHDGRHPDMPSWISSYAQYSRDYTKPQFTLASMKTSSPKHKSTVPLNPNAKPFVPITTQPRDPEKVNFILVSVDANGKHKQVNIPELKEGKIRLPEDIAAKEIAENPKKFGSQPSLGAEMKWTLFNSGKKQKDRFIQVDFHFSSGEDKNRQCIYNGKDESKFLPNTSIGQLILNLYIVAFRDLKMFELKHSGENEPYMLSCIDESNTARNFTPFFYQQTIEALRKRGITLDLLQEEVNKEHNLLQKEVFVEDKKRA